MKKRLYLFSCLLFFTWSLQSQETSPELPTLSLSIEEYTQMAFNRGIQSQIIEENLRTARWSWQAGKRQLTWPTLTSQFSGSQTGSNNDLGTQSETEQQSATLTLAQPFLTGTNVSLSGTLTTADTESESFGTKSTFKTRDRPNFSATVTQPLFIFTKNDQKRSWETNNLQWENTQAIHTSDRLNIEFNARQIYFDLLLSSMTVEIEKRKLTSTEVLADITRRRVNRGRLPASSLSRVEIVKEEDQRRVENAETRLTQAWNQARDFVLLPPAQETSLSTPLEYQPFNVSIDRLMEEGEKSNPFLVLSRNSVRFSEISLQQTKEGTRPNVDLSGTYTENIDESQSPGLQPYTWDARVDVNWTLFDATQTQLSTKQSLSSLRNSRRSYENELRQLKVNLKNAHLDAERIEKQVTDLEKQVGLARDSRDALRGIFRNGEASLTDVFDAEDRLRSTELEYVGLLVSYNNALDRLKVLVGRDLNF